MTPIGSGVFTYNPAGILVSGLGIPSMVPTTHARVYVDRSENHNTGLAIANVGSAAAGITVNAFQMDGVAEAGTSLGPLPLDGYGHDSKFADQLIEGLPEGFRGVLDISSAISEHPDFQDPSAEFAATATPLSAGASPSC
jgi:hypothetical protein